MKEQVNEKKIRWNISKSMSCVYQKLNDSKLKIKKSKAYLTAMEKLKKLYKINEIQVWILSLSSERYFERHDSISIRNIADNLGVSVMEILNWKNEIDKLLEIGFLEQKGSNNAVRPVSEFRDTLYSNTSFIPKPRNEIGDTEFIRHMASRYESRRDEGMSSSDIQNELLNYEQKNANIEVVKRVSAEISNPNDRFFLYDVSDDILHDCDSGLKRTVSDLYDGDERYQVCAQMMEGTHSLFKNGFIEFIKKGNLAEATLTLSDKGKKLLLGDKAFLFEDSINDKNMIKVADIKEKRLFYSKENQKEIERLENALQNDKFKCIQKRLKEEGLPIGVAVLLYGAPGTGKTESVMQIAKKTGRSIVHVDNSESKSLWFGESEKLVKKIFTSYKHACDVAEKKNELMPILLFNEADALISKRKDSNAGNCSQTENAIQNIILEELENLKGIFIATTNLASNMDSAFERRFLFKIKFENPSIEAKSSIWMNKLSWLDEKEATEFAKEYDFSGGQIDNIVRKIAMNEVIVGERPSITDIHDMCKCEKIDKPDGEKRIGFCV